MSAVIRDLTDKDGTKIYPPTVARAVYMENGVDSVSRVLNDMRDQNTTISFINGNINKTLASGNTVTTTFGLNTITEVTKNSDNVVLQTKITTFNDDGTIGIEVS